MPFSFSEKQLKDALNNLLKITTEFFIVNGLETLNNETGQKKFALHLEYFYWLLNLAEQCKFSDIEGMTGNHLFKIAEVLRLQFYEKNYWMSHADISFIFQKLVSLPEFSDHQYYGAVTTTVSQLTNPLKKNNQENRSFQALTQSSVAPRAKNVNDVIVSLQSAAAAVWSFHIKNTNRTDSAYQAAILQLNTMEVSYQYYLLTDHWLNSDLKQNFDLAFEGLDLLASRLHAVGQTQEALETFKLIRRLLEKCQHYANFMFDSSLLIPGLLQLNQKVGVEAVSFVWETNLKMLEESRSTLVLDDSNDIVLFQTTQKKLAKNLQEFLNKLFTHGEEMLGAPPCAYEVVVTGSMARADMTLFSDIECLVLLEPKNQDQPQNKDYFKTLCQLVKFQLLSLGNKNQGFGLDEWNPATDFDLIDIPSVITTKVKSSLAEFKTGLLKPYFTFLSPCSVRKGGNLATNKSLLEQYHTELINAGINIPIEAKELLAIHQQDFFNKIITVEINKAINVNIKEIFLNPLSYLLTDLSLYHQLKENNLFDILAKLSGKALAPDFMQTCQQALSFLQRIRLKNHLAAKKKNDVISLDNQGIKSQLVQIMRGLIKPLYEHSQRFLQLTKPFHPIFDPLRELMVLQKDKTPENQKKQTQILESAVAYLLYNFNPEQNMEEAAEIFIEAYQAIPGDLPEIRKQFLKLLKDAKWLNNSSGKEDILDILAHEQNPDGWFPAMDEEENNWYQNLAALVEEKSLTDDAIITSLAAGKFIIKMRDLQHNPNNNKSPNIKTYIFKPEILKQIQTLFDEKGNLKPRSDDQPGRHIVKRIVYRDPLTQKEKSFWLKLWPEQAGIDYAISRLDRYLGGQLTPMNCLFKLYSKGEPEGFAVQVSAEIGGEPLVSVISEKDAKGKLIYKEIIAKPECLIQLSMASFTQNLLRVLLTNPEDDKGDDYFLIPEKNNKYTLCRIDNERSFYSPEEENKKVGFQPIDHCKLKVFYIVYHKCNKSRCQKKF